MEPKELDALVERLLVGFEALHSEYQKLHGQHRALGKRLARQQEQHKQFAEAHGSSAITSPPLSSSSSHTQQQDVGIDAGQERVDTIQKRTDTSEETWKHIEGAFEAARRLRANFTLRTKLEDGVKIWSGRSADEVPPTRSPGLKPVGSPLEQDFTIEGVPSKLGCPLASMRSKKLSSHAASVLSRYKQGSTNASPSTLISAASRVNGRESFARRNSQQPDLVDPIKADIDHESPQSERALKDHLEEQDEGEVGVCPIRFLDQHSPEEVATYFEKHKHELPRSHEVCVKRYQSNEQQIRQLDARYGSLVTMIQGLGAKHMDMLPKEPDDEGVNVDEDTKSAQKVRKWASGISTRAADGNDAVEDDEDRQPRFDRPLREIRVGESPSRPWGIPVPAKYLEQHDNVAANPAVNVDEAVNDGGIADARQPAAAAKCPFSMKKDAEKPEGAAVVDGVPKDSLPVSGRSVFMGPVFFGYSAEDAAKILQGSGFGSE